jgi:Asp/Glu/hydantoin racemase
MKKFAIIHTTTATVGPLKALAQELLPEWGVLNFVDDSVLPQLLENGGRLDAVQSRLVQYARYAEEVGALGILNACSSVGESVAIMRRAVSVPVLRIDEAMAENAVQQAESITVAATLPTTLQPTLRLIEQKAAEIGRRVEVTPLLVEGAFQKLGQGDQAGHDALLLFALSGAAQQTDLVVLAQASMARVIPALPDELQPKFLSSPRSGMAHLRTVLKETYG